MFDTRGGINIRNLITSENIFEDVEIEIIDDKPG